MPQIDSQKIANALDGINAKITMFADGFIDEVWEIVNARASLSDFSVYSKMNQFADRITGSGSGGVGLELIKKRRAFGGFTANIGYQTARLGVDTTMVGVFGKDSLDPIFEPVGEICRVLSLDNAAVTHVFEFDDGKILMSDMEAVQYITWSSIIEKLGEENVKSMLTQSAVIGVGYYSLLPAFDEIVENVCKLLPNDDIARRFFFDFADFRKKDEASLGITLDLLKTLNSKMPITLSLNEHEAAALYTKFGETLDNKKVPLHEKLEIVRAQLGFDELVVHSPHYAAAALAGEQPVFLEAVYNEKPVRSAGAGDSFNGGYLAARLAGLSISERLHVANASVSYFLKTGVFPTSNEMISQIK